MCFTTDLSHPRIALNQFASRGWLSYTDLVTIWDTMDTQTALLTATKQVAKVHLHHPNAYIRMYIAFALYCVVDLSPCMLSCPQWVTALA